MATDKDYQVKGVFNKMKQAVHYYNVMESKVLQATNTDAWGAPSTLMRSLAQGTMESGKLDVIMSALYRRLTVKDTRQWLQVYKALVLLEYLLKYGDDQVLAYAQSHPDVLISLQSFEFIDEKGQDKGYNVRVRSKTVNELVKDPEEIKRIRENGRLSQDRFIGVSSDDHMATTSPTMEEKKEEAEVVEANVSTKQLPPIQPPPSSTTAVATVVAVNTTTTTPVSPQQQQQQQDDMDDAIFREDFIDPLEEDNHAMVFPVAGGKGKKTKLSMDEFSSSSDDDDGQQDKKKKKEQKKKSRFSLSGVFSRSKQPAAKIEEQQQDTATPEDSSVENNTTQQQPTMETCTTVTSMETADTNDDDAWGDFASPDKGTDILGEVEVVTEQKEDDLLDLDCDMMTTSSARTSVDNNDLLLLDVDMASFNNNNSTYGQYHHPMPPMMNNNPPTMMNHYSANTPTMMNHYSANTPTMMNHYSANTPTMMNHYSANTPTTPFDFDPLGYTGLKTPTTPPPAPAAPQQLTQHWYPWMATTTSSYQQKQEQQRPMTVDDLLA